MKKSKMAKQLQFSEDSEFPFTEQLGVVYLLREEHKESARDVCAMLKEELLENILLLQADREDFQLATKALDRQVQNLEAQIVTLKNKHHKTLAKTHKRHKSN